MRSAGKIVHAAGGGENRPLEIQKQRQGALGLPVYEEC
jgi:hypothetical protein